VAIVQCREEAEVFTTLSAIDLALDVTFAQAATLAGEAGFDAVDLPMEELVGPLNGADASGVEVTLAAAGVRAGGWWLPVEFREDHDTYTAGLETLVRAAALSERVGSHWCNTWMWPFSDELDYAANRRLHVERLKPVAAMLAERGIVLGLEYVGPRTLRAGHRYEFISTMAETLELIDDIGERNVGLLLDCWQWYTSHGTSAELGALTPERVTYVHLNDAPAGVDADEQIDDRRMLPGATGVIDVGTFLGALTTMGFAGPVAVEPFNAEVNALEPPERVRAAQESLTETFAKVGVRYTTEQRGSA
jgi:sugar phosphate isomerase/epimerase